jgi:hypothetical protein
MAATLSGEHAAVKACIMPWIGFTGTVTGRWQKIITEELSS